MSCGQDTTKKGWLEVNEHAEQFLSLTKRIREIGASNLEILRAFKLLYIVVFSEDPPTPLNEDVIAALTKVEEKYANS
jgi:hypothetical protein